MVDIGAPGIHECPMRHRPDEMLTRVLEITGGASGLARMVGSSRQAVHKWKRIPVQHIDRVSAVSGIDKAQLRPDLDFRD